MKKEYIASLTILSLGVLLLANAYIDYSERNVVSIQSSFGGHADWPYFETIEELKSDSDLIITGSIVESKSERVKVTSLDVPGQYMTFTEYTLSIESVVLGQYDSRQITVRQTGNIEKPKTQLADHPMLNTKADLLLFLKEVEPDVFVLTGGPQGHYQIQNSLVYSIGELNVRSIETTKALHQNGAKLNDFISSIDP